MRPSAWQPDARAFDGFAPLDQQLRFALQYAALVPSNHNAQPWRFLVNGDAVQILADRTRALPVVDPFDRELLISCGAALFNLCVALSQFGLAYSITLFPSEADPDIVANLSVARGGHRDVELVNLFDAITARVTTRAPFVDEVIPRGVADEAGCCVRSRRSRGHLYRSVRGAPGDRGVDREGRSCAVRGRALSARTGQLDSSAARTIGSRHFFAFGGGWQECGLSLIRRRSGSGRTFHAWFEYTVCSRRESL
jgi:hypothetical protein